MRGLMEQTFLSLDCTKAGQINSKIKKQGKPFDLLGSFEKYDNRYLVQLISVESKIKNPVYNGHYIVFEAILE